MTSCVVIGRENTSNEIVRYKYVCNCDACISPFIQKEIFHSSSRPTTVLDFPSFYGLWYQKIRRSQIKGYIVFSDLSQTLKMTLNDPDRKSLPIFVVIFTLCITPPA